MVTMSTMKPHRGHSFHHSRGEFGREEHRGYGQQSQQSSGEQINPYGRQPIGQAHRLGQQFTNPLSAYFGVQPEFGTGRKGQRQEARYNQQMSAVENSDSPLAQYMRQAGAYLPQVMGKAQGVGENIASMAPGIFDQIRNQVQGALGQLPGLQQTAQQQTGQAQNFLNQAASPIANQALYQNALRQGLEGQRAGQGARGLLDAGSAQGMEEGFGRDLAAQFAQNQFANQQQALQGAQGALGAQAGLLPMGGQLAGMLQSALPGLQQALQAGYQLPMDALQQVFNQFSAYQNPQLALIGATGPQIAQRSSGGGYNVL